MNKIIAFTLLILVLCALKGDQTHHQSRPATATSTNTAASFNYRPSTPPISITNNPAKINHQPHKEPGYQPKAGNPFGRDPRGHLTCFQNPCYDPVGSCTKNVNTRSSVNTRTKSRTSLGRASNVGRTLASSNTQSKTGSWKPIAYVVRVNGRKARFTGYRCV